MVTWRGKKGDGMGDGLKSAGLKQIACCGLGLVALMLLSFTIGVLAGRGDIYRLLSRWGLVQPQSLKVAQPWLAPEAAPPTRETAASKPAAKTPAASAGTARKREAPAKGSLAALPSSSSAKKARRTKDQKAQEEAQTRQAVARQLKFHNTQGAPPSPKAKRASKAKAGSGTTQAKALKKVGTFRDKKLAQAKAAALKRKGVEVTLKTVKDEQGTAYILYKKEKAADRKPKKAAKVASKAKKAKPRPQPDDDD